MACISIVLASPLQNHERGLPVCKIIDEIVNVLHANQATPLCSSLLGIAPKTITQTNTLTQLATNTQTAYQTSTILKTITVDLPTTIEDFLTSQIPITATTTVPGSTVYTATVYSTIANPVFASGEPPAPVKRDDMSEKRAVVLPPWASSIGKAVLSTACSCLSLTTPTVTATATATSYVTATIAVTSDIAATASTSVDNVVTVYQTSSVQTTLLNTVTVSTPVYQATTVTVSTVYPCATSALSNPNSGSYVAENPGAQVGLQTHNFAANTIVDCCNLCMFGQAYCRWASFDAGSNTCAVSQIDGGRVDSNPNFPNPKTCADGGIFGENFGPSFSSSLIAGPCGESYDYSQTS